MKINKYVSLAQRHPFLSVLLREMCSPYAKSTNEDLTLYLKGRVRYIAYRPWDSLNLESKNETQDLGHVPHAYSHQHFWSGVRYQIYFWIGDEKVPRARSVDSPWDDDQDALYTIVDVINHLRAWYLDCFSPKGIPIRWEAIVKVSSEGGVTISPSTIEVYPFPDNFK